MKRLTFIAILMAAIFSLNANSAKAQVGVHVGLSFGTPYYYHPRAVYVAPPPPAPVYYSEPAYCPPPRPYYYGPRRVVVVDRPYYYGPRRVVVVNRYRGYYRRW